MTRPDSRADACRAALRVGVVTLLTLAAALVTISLPTAMTSAMTTAPAAAAQDDSPLAVSMDSLTPAVLPQQGPVTVTGEVTNRSDGDWRDLQVYLLTSRTPIGDGAALADAAASDPATEVGARLTATGLFAEIGDLAPGASTPYTLTVDRSALQVTGEPGVYWIGVHVLGAGDGARDSVADGRARAFAPLVSSDTPTVRLAVTVPLRQPVRRGPDNRLLGLERWQRSLAPGGRLERLLSFAGSSPRPLTWIVDPAVLDAARSVAQDDPSLSTANDGSGDGQDAAPSESPGPGDPSGSPDADPGDEDQPSVAARQATAWLERFRAQPSQLRSMAVPYGDLDVAAVTNNRLVDLVRDAKELSSAAMRSHDVAADPVIAPPNGYLPGRALSRLDDDAPVLISHAAMPQATQTLLTRKSGVDVALAEAGAATGGPGPNDPESALALRQRILAEAAVRAMSPDSGEPLIVGLPEGWNPGPEWQQASFFSGLDQPWLRQVPLGAVLAGGPGPLDTTLPIYPARQRRDQIPFANQLATRELIRTGRSFAELLTFNDAVAGELSRTAMLASSYAAREHPGQALARARAASNQVRLRMGRVSIEGPPFVMMSSASGAIAVTLVNDLDRAVTVRLEAVTGSDALTIEVPGAIILDPGQRTAVRMPADATGIGVRSVTLRATTENGVRVGDPVQFSVRTSNVGLVIWLVMAGGAAIFVLAIAARIRRQVRRRRAALAMTLQDAP